MASITRFRLIGISDLDRQCSGFFGRIVVSAREYGIADIDHVLNRNAKDVAELANSVGFVDARLGDVMDVVPPSRTENSGMSLSRIALIFFRLAKSGSHFFLSSSGACCPARRT